MTKHSPSRSPLRAFASPDVGGVVQGAAALVWLPQAALLAMAVQRLASGRGFEVVIWSAGAILLLGLLRAGCEAWGARRTFARARAQLTALRAQTAAALAGGSPLDRGRAPSGLAASVLAEQAEALVPYLVRYQPARWRATVVPIFILCAVAAFSWVAALVLLVAAPLIPLFMAIVGWRARAASEAQMVELGGMNAFLLDRLRGLATLRALGAVEITARRLGDAAQSLRRRTMAVLRIAFLSSAVLELFSALGVALVAVYVGFHLLGSIGFGAWGRTLSLGEGLFVLLLAPAFFEPLRELSAVWHDRAAGEAALEALEHLQRNELPLPGAGASLTRAATGVCGDPPAVAIHNLHFSWPGEQHEVFDGDELRIAPGEHIALMGPSGSGKTALLSLLAGLVPATRGEISIGGVALTEHTVAALRQRMGWMGQAPHVFAGSVESNVALGRAGVNTPQVNEAVHFASLEAVAQAHPSTSLGEGGGGLSGGEAVRLALARIAVHPQADLLLVDEPTAHLDTETAERVADALVKLAHGKTLIVATHDPVLASRMDRTVSLGRTDAMEKAA
ncbi:thiol reductant ABC exporter subunit CydD [Variovorax sp. NFACC27]|uniref:thiol reductant ABC exporter subunit CydD n=1 Tax=unclassified Variovorax TaxID=663243 RepID=UPI00089D0D86|nr:ATP-binding cassette, subfamily C, CydD [Variovorax sp. NFACC28]SEG98549.1 ATP-binding cassette, subfamily C, CydD [Variovorax sp. NFACC29]SFD46259.1 ATP-binding cassette, subfamily C, CydD [Variovorax sp. NFACC26]SFH17782.1 ATP-binding cassette, subfamily C, CydD [Variovorax sp. NFACC27]